MSFCPQFQGWMMSCLIGLKFFRALECINAYSLRKWLSRTPRKAKIVHSSPQTENRTRLENQIDSIQITKKLPAFLLVRLMNGLLNPHVFIGLLMSIGTYCYGWCLKNRLEETTHELWGHISPKAQESANQSVLTLIHRFVAHIFVPCDVLCVLTSKIPQRYASKTVV